MSMLLEHTGQPKAGARVMQAIQTVTGTKMKSQAAGKMGYGTSQIGDLVVEGARLSDKRRSAACACRRRVHFEIFGAATARGACLLRSRHTPCAVASRQGGTAHHRRRLRSP